MLPLQPPVDNKKNMVILKVTMNFVLKLLFISASLNISVALLQPPAFPMFRRRETDTDNDLYDPATKHGMPALRGLSLELSNPFHDL